MLLWHEILHWRHGLNAGKIDDTFGSVIHAGCAALAAKSSKVCELRTTVMTRAAAGWNTGLVNIREAVSLPLPCD